jgi:hypothetical protein
MWCLNTVTWNHTVAFLSKAFWIYTTSRYVTGTQIDLRPGMLLVEPVGANSRAASLWGTEIHPVTL